MLPNFLGIGAQRGATTWLFNCLKEHPEVFVPEVKEVSFFSIHYDKGITYYSSFFRDAKGYRAVGEISPDYLYGKDCAERIYRHLPNIKMIAILRNPIDRAFSDYQYFTKPKTGWSFEQSIEREPRILEKGLYCDQLEKYFYLYDRKQFLIILYEDLIADNLKAIKSAYKFLGVNHDFYPSWIGKTVNTSSSSNLRGNLKKLRLEWLIEWIKKTPIDSLVRNVHGKRKKKPKFMINKKTRAMLIEYFRRPNENLEEMMGLSLSMWKEHV